VAILTAVRGQFLGRINGIPTVYFSSVAIPDPLWEGFLHAKGFFTPGHLFLGAVGPPFLFWGLLWPALSFFRHCNQRPKQLGAALFYQGFFGCPGHLIYYYAFGCQLFARHSGAG